MQNVLKYIYVLLLYKAELKVYYKLGRSSSVFRPNDEDHESGKMFWKKRASGCWVKGFFSEVNLLYVF